MSTVANIDQSRGGEIAARCVSVGNAEPVLKLNYVVKKWLAQNELSMLYGPSNVGKTFVALDFCLHIALGKEWIGHRVRGGPVFYVAAEGGAGIVNRLAGLKREYPEFTDAPFVLCPVSIDLHGQGDAVAVCEAIEAIEQVCPTPPTMIVIDTLARSMGDGDENSAKDTGKVVGNCDLIRKVTGAHVMIVHHSGKDEDRGARGSSALRGAVDAQIQVTSQGEIICNKQRNMPRAEPLHFQLQTIALGTDEDGDTVTSAIVIPADRPAPTKKPLSGKNEVAMQALDDALRDHGEERSGNLYPQGRKVVHVDHWKKACKEHGLTSGESESAARTAFNRAKVRLMDLNEVREWGDHVWRVREDD